MGKYQYLVIILFITITSGTTYSQTNTGNNEGSSSFINLSDTNSIYNNSKYVDIQEMFYPNPQTGDEGTNDPTNSGMTLEFIQGYEIYRKVIQIAPGAMLEIIFYPKKDE